MKLHAPTTSHWQTCCTTICFRQSAGWHRAELHTAAIEASWSCRSSFTKGGPYATLCPAPPGIGAMQIVGVLCCPDGQMVLQGKLLISSGRWVGAFFYAATEAIMTKADCWVFHYIMDMFEQKLEKSWACWVSLAIGIGLFFCRIVESIKLNRLLYMLELVLGCSAFKSSS